MLNSRCQLVNCTIALSLSQTMAAPAKKHGFDVNNKSKSRNNKNQQSDGGGPEDEILHQEGLKIQIDFEGRNPQDPDCHGIKTLLKQLLLKSHVDIGGLTDIIISQNYIGSVIKQSQDEEDQDDEEEDDIDDVFGITTVVNLSSRQNQPCIQQLRELLSKMASEHGTDATNTMIQNLLGNENATLGLLINERFVNIPVQISVPLLENLVSEINRAVGKGMPFKFEYLILICKLYKEDDKKKVDSSSEIIWSNPEEEIFAQEATCSFEFSVEKDSDSGLSGAWEEDDTEMTPYRRVLLFEATKLQDIINKIKSEIAGH